ncbi:sugar kinase [Streptomyces sp. NPDC052610]|uniref:sugar kinase n=1 Tax=Streptomyces sp. NPDC052610 TaxID=3154952 RepID=UPI003418BDD7
MTAGPLPYQPGPADEPERPAEDRSHMIRRRALTLLIIVLLIGIPAGYLVISANQSRDSGKDKEEKYSATGLTEGWPSKVQRRLYQVPIPHPANKVAWYETNNWKTSRLYVQFQTTHDGLDAFLAELGADRHDLVKDDITIGARDRDVSGWTFSGPTARPGPDYGLVRTQKNPKPSQNVVVNFGNPTYPMVYVVSRTVP